MFIFCIINFSRYPIPERCLLLAGQTARKSLVFQAPDGGDAPPPKKRSKRAKKGKRKTSAPKKKPPAKAAAKRPSRPGSAAAADLDSVFLQWKRKVPALRGLSASEAATILEQEAERFDGLTPTKAKKLASKFRNALVELSPSLQMANDFAVERDPEVLRCEWVNKLREEISKLRSKREASASTTFSPDSFVGAFIDSRNKAKSPVGHKPHPRGDDHEAENGEYVVSSSSCDESSSESHQPLRSPMTSPQRPPPQKRKAAKQRLSALLIMTRPCPTLLR